MTVPELRILIVSPNPLARGGLTSLVQGMTGVKAVGAGGIAEAASLAGQLLPDAVLLDAGDGEPEDLDAIARLAAAQPGLPIVALSGDQSAVSQALAFGASALLPLGTDAETLAAALLASARGLATIARADLATLLPEEERIDPAVKAPTEALTHRELEVLQLMARGLTNRQIARRLQISEHTVKFHAGAILGKLSARSRAEAVARAIGLGWILV
jgi:two-component system, NarL family, nitrate/nitrite response regulator NarL